MPQNRFLLNKLITKQKKKRKDNHHLSVVGLPIVQLIKNLLVQYNP